MAGKTPASTLIEADDGTGSRLTAKRATLYRAPLPVKPGQPIKLRLFADRSLFELYANDELVISAVGFFHAPEKLTATTFTRDGAPEKITVEAWPMNALKWSVRTAAKPGE